MDRVRANRIVSAYHCVGDLVAGLRYGAPESLLPYPKEQIKAALKVLLLEDHESTAQMQYMSSFLLLSRFVPDEQARRGIVIQAALDAEDAEWLAEQDVPARMVSAIHYERLALHKELKHFLEGN